MLTQEQLQNRKKGIGGSDAPAILGVSKYQTPLDVFFDKITEEIADQTPTPAQDRGNRLEPLIIEKFTEITGKRCVIDKNTFFHPNLPFMLAHFDAIVEKENALVEAKTTTMRNASEWGMQGSDNVPKPYLIQMAHQAEVKNADIVYMIVLFVDTWEFRIYEYKRNSKLADVIIKKEKEFWNKHVKTKTPPPPSDAKDALQLWKVAIEGTNCIATDQVIALLSQAQTLKMQMKSLDEEYKELVTQIQNVMQTKDSLIDSNGNVLATWKNQRSQRFSQADFKVAQPEMYKNFLRNSVNRVFRLKGDLYGE